LNSLSADASICRYTKRILVVHYLIKRWVNASFVLVTGFPRTGIEQEEWKNSMCMLLKIFFYVSNPHFGSFQEPERWAVIVARIHSVLSLQLVDQ
jgi:hypothetical protein